MKVLLVGHCGPDGSYLRSAVRAANGAAQILSADDWGEVTRAVADGVDLILLNRVLDYGFEETSGIDLTARLKSSYPNVKIMLVSNHADAQAAAVAAGAIPGFGKREIGSPKVSEILQNALRSDKP